MARRFSAAVVLVALSLWLSPATAQADGPVIGPLTLLKDINPGPTQSTQSVDGMVNVGGLYLLLAVNEPTYGYTTGWWGGELWRSDGTANGTYLVKDINPGQVSSMPQQLTHVAGKTYFTAADGSHGNELWVSDGTTAGTVMVKDIWPGAAGSYSTELTPTDTSLFFTASDGTHGVQLWVTDGTEAGTTMLTDAGGAAGSNPGWLVEFGPGRILFRGSDADHGTELWISDGSSLGTTLFRDLLPGPAGSNPDRLHSVGDTVYFSAWNPATGREPWRTTATVTELLVDIVPGFGSSNPQDFSGDGVSIYFSAEEPATGREMYRSTGTPGPAERFDINVGPGSSDPGPVVAVFYGDGDRLAFFTATAPGLGRELYRLADTDITAVLVRDIFLGPSGSYPTSLTAIGEQLYFSADNGTDGEELWKCVRVGSPWHVLQTSLVANISPSGNAYPSYLTPMNGKLYFGAHPGNRHGALWQSDGTSTGTVAITDFRPSAFDAFPHRLTLHGSSLYFVAGDANGLELWKSDGTTPGTTLAADINPGPGDSFAVQPWQAFHIASMADDTPGGAGVYFPAFGAPSGSALWRYDGSSLTTVKLTDGDEYHCTPDWLTGFNGWLYAPANDATHGTELWRANGIPEGQPGAVFELVADVWPGGDSSYPTELIPYHGWLYFVANGAGVGRELWRSDGIPGGVTERVADINPGTGSSNPDDLTGIGAFLCFTAQDGDAPAGHGREIWCTGGSGAEMHADLCPGPCSFEPRDLTASGRLLYFTANDDVPGVAGGGHGSELWRDDGRPGGVYLVKDILPGPLGSGPTNIADVAGRLWFSASDGEHGAEPWVSDGQPAGTYMLQDLFTGPGNANPSDFTVLGSKVYFSANHATMGYELWSGQLGFETFMPLARRDG